MAVDVKGWATKFKNLTDSDPTIAAMGKYYTCTFMYDMGERKVIVEMHDAYLFVASISDGSALGVVAVKDANLGLIGYEMTVLVDRIGAHLTPELVAELKSSLEP